MESNIFVTKLYDIVIPDDAVIGDEEEFDEQQLDKDLIRILTGQTDEN